MSDRTKIFEEAKSKTSNSGSINESQPLNFDNQSNVLSDSSKDKTNRRNRSNSSEEEVKKTFMKLILTKEKKIKN